MSIYPEHDKLAELGEVNTTISQFLTWLNNNGIVLVERLSRCVVKKSDMELIAGYLGLDEGILREEKERMRIKQLEAVEL